MIGVVQLRTLAGRGVRHRLTAKKKAAIGR
jgi:hypothetical protein